MNNLMNGPGVHVTLVKMIMVVMYRSCHVSDSKHQSYLIFKVGWQLTNRGSIKEISLIRRRKKNLPSSSSLLRFSDR